MNRAVSHARDEVKTRLNREMNELTNQPLFCRTYLQEGERGKKVLFSVSCSQIVFWDEEEGKKGKREEEKTHIFVPFEL